jgi:hypothetical protein
MRDVSKRRRWISIVLNAALSLCALATTASAAIEVSPTEIKVTDPAGDTFGSAPIFDIKEVSATRVGDDLVVRLEFYHPIFSASSGADPAVLATVALDLAPFIDMGVALQSLHGGLPPPNPGSLGIENSVDTFFEVFSPGLVDLLDADFQFVAQYPVTFEANAFFVAVPLIEFGLDSTSDLAVELRIGAVAGAYGGNGATDQAPNIEGGVIPEPSSLVIFGVGLAFLAAGSRLRSGRIKAC